MQHLVVVVEFSGVEVVVIVAVAAAAVVDDVTIVAVL